MMNNSKILTVSYGTFSCTLEGFEDSFGTMKAIAEYFRDLAAEDRYFGAEPPQPDAEMLAHIAQREVSRRVQAREQDGKIVLSALEDDARPAPAPQIAATASASAGEPLVSTSFAPRRPNEISAYYDAYRMNSLRASTVAPAADAPAPQEQPKAAPAPAEADDTSHEADAPKEAIAEAAPAQDKTSATSAEAAPEVEADIVPGQPDEEVEAFFAESTADAPADDLVDEANNAAPVNTAKAESIAAKLQRIRAVVSRQETAAVDPDYTEDEHAEESAEPETAASKSVIADAIHDIEDALDTDDAAEQTGTASDDNADEDDDVSALLSRLDEEDAARDSSADGVVADAAKEAETPSREAAVADTEAATDDTTQAAADQEDAPAPRGRVIKVKRADLDRAIAQGELEEYDSGDANTAETSDETEAADANQDADDITAAIAETSEDTSKNDAQGEEPKAAAAPDGASGSSLSAEEEAELARELAEVEAALADPKADAESAREKSAQNARRVLPSLDAGQGSDINRLLAETDNQMDDPENTNRRDAITNLRAAVAAKKADVALGAAERDDDGDAYRSDLAEVVKPRRPAAGSARTERPGEGKPAPLKLVAEQRIDTVRPSEPVRPRRVASVAATETPASAAGGFADFAEEMGAVKLPDLLEAAAAYMSFVEGLDQFSRPQLMNTVRQADPEDFSREDGLRSFGQLLRNGKLQKLDGGRFRASENIGFQPDTRAAG